MTPPARPMPLDMITRAIAAMRWTVLCDPRAAFLTGDTPVGISPKGCLVAPTTELVFPLGPARALLCDWTGPPSAVAIETASPASVRDINRRVARAAVQRVYSNRPIDRQRIAALLSDRRPHRIVHRSRRSNVPARVARDFDHAVRDFHRRRIVEHLELVASLLAESQR